MGVYPGALLNLKAIPRIQCYYGNILAQPGCINENEIYAPEANIEQKKETQNFNKLNFLKKGHLQESKIHYVLDLRKL